MLVITVGVAWNIFSSFFFKNVLNGSRRCDTTVNVKLVYLTGGKVLVELIISLHLTSFKRQEQSRVTKGEVTSTVQISVTT